MANVQPKIKHRPFCFSVKGHVKMLRLVRPRRGGREAVEAARGAGDVGMKCKAERPVCFSASL